MRYDAETGLYYLNSRYYDSITGRFINADGYVSAGQGVLGNNMFAYCGNNPVSRYDPLGNCWLAVGGTCIIDVECGTQVSGKNRKLIKCEVSASKLKEMGFKDTSPHNVNELTITLWENGIDTKNEIAHFLAQCAKETELGTWLTEIGSSSYFASKPYGYKYRGAGYIQVTWDYNYRSFATAANDPEIYNQGADYVAANYAWQAAGWFWNNNNINAKIANGASVRDVTLIVRGSSSTWQERQAYYDRFLGILW